MHEYPFYGQEVDGDVYGETEGAVVDLCRLYWAYCTVVGGLCKVLQEMRAPRGFVNRIAALHRDTHVKVRFGSLLGEEFRTKLGLRQGCVLAPILFNLYLESIMGRASKDMCGVEVSVSMF